MMDINAAGADIRAIIFDLGGVILRTDDPQPRSALAMRLGRTYAELDQIVFGNPISQQGERGQATPEQIWAEIGRLLNLTSEQISTFRQEFFGGDKVDSLLVQLIQRLRKSYRIGLLSNAWYRDMPRFLHENLKLPDLFDVVISSAAVEMAKPDRKIFELALEKLAVQPEQAVFVDDNQDNIRAAAYVGIHTVHFKSTAQAQNELAQILNITLPSN
jgi:glucose-1-phosphatase